jgi:uncharacterized protein YqgC (DUF456 family)
MAGFLFVLWLILLVVLLLTGMVLNLLGLAGNWVMLASMVVHTLIAEAGARTDIGVLALVILLVMALIGEGLEFLAGMLGAGKAGGSRRAILLAFVGSLVGAGFGFGLGNAVVPLAGGVVGVLLLGSAGALAGAVLGETWKGRSLEESLEVGRGAFVGRLVGTLSKSFVGTAMFVIAVGALMV